MVITFDVIGRQDLFYPNRTLWVFAVWNWVDKLDCSIANFCFFVMSILLVNFWISIHISKFHSSDPKSDPIEFRPIKITHPLTKPARDIKWTRPMSLMWPNRLIGGRTKPVRLARIGWLDWWTNWTKPVRLDQPVPGQHNPLASVSTWSSTSGSDPMLMPIVVM